MTPCKNAQINVFEYYPRVYIEGGYYSFRRTSAAGIIRVWVLFKGGSYMRKYVIYALAQNSQEESIVPKLKGLTV